jgi:hypothetical protein
MERHTEAPPAGTRAIGLTPGPRPPPARRCSGAARHGAQRAGADADAAGSEGGVRVLEGAGTAELRGGAVELRRRFRGQNWVGCEPSAEEVLGAVSLRIGGWSGGGLLKINLDESCFTRAPLGQSKVYSNGAAGVVAEAKSYSGSQV